MLNYYGTFTHNSDAHFNLITDIFTNKLRVTAEMENSIFADIYNDPETEGFELFSCLRHKQRRNRGITYAYFI